MAGLRVALSRLGGRSRRKKVKVKVNMVKWWHKMVFPVRKVMFALSNRAKPRKNGTALLNLHEDIKTCEYEDVRVMWEMLSRTEPEVATSKRSNKPKLQRSFWKNFTCSNPNSTSVAHLVTDQKH